MKNFLKLATSIIVCQLAGIIGSIFTISSIPTWYASLNKPFFNPPNWIFGPVWTILYLLMGVSLYLIWQQKKSKKRTNALIVFASQLGLNTLWSIIFFGMQSPFLAFLVIVGLLIFIILTIIKFFPLSKTAAYLLIPYILWVSFASILNFSIVVLN